MTPRPMGEERPVQHRHLVAEQVRAARTRKQWTRGRLADEVQATHAEITAVELSATDAAPDLLGRIAAVLGVSIDGAKAPVRLGRSPSRSRPSPAPTPPTDLAERKECAEMSDTPRSDQTDTPAMTAADSAPPTPTDQSEPAETNGTGAARRSAGATTRARRPRAGATEAASASPNPDMPSTLSPIASTATDDRERQVVALLERVAGGRFVYQDGYAWLLHDEDAMVAESRLLAAYALLTDALLSEGASVGDDEREQVRRLHRGLFGMPIAHDATRRGGRR